MGEILFHTHFNQVEKQDPLGAVEIVIFNYEIFY